MLRAVFNVCHTRQVHAFVARRGWGDKVHCVQFPHGLVYGFLQITHEYPQTVQKNAQTFPPG